MLADFSGFRDPDLALRHLPLGVAALLVSAAAFAQSPGGNGDEELAEITVRATRVANPRPAGSYAALATALRFNPLTELQSRGLAEGQADVTVRGGLFENTGFAIGAVTVMDPQTGHYTAELPIDPALLSVPQMLTGIDNAIRGFNSSIATVSYTVPALQRGGQVLLGAGSDDLNFQSLRIVGTRDLANDRLGGAVSAAFSRGDGSVANGDHDFERFNLQLQRSSADSQSDLMIAYQDKFYGWPGAYTGFASLPETDHTTTTLILFNHRGASDTGWFEVAALFRKLDDDYDFNRMTQESGAPGSFDHETRIYGIGFQGSRRHGAVGWRYGGQVSQDELVRSTDLTNGSFDRRRYAKLTLLPTFDVAQGQDRTLNVRVGASLDYTNRDGSTISPLIGARFEQGTPARSTFVDVEYASTSQVPGYTALNSRPAGLFGGNPDLGREKARQLTLAVGRESAEWTAAITVFLRRDDGLVDWTFASGAPFARQANAVDADVLGIEALVTRRWGSLDLAAGITLIDKDADYGTAVVDASYYALNYARHRATLALHYRVTDAFELRMDNEYRVQQDNPLRSSSANSYSAGLSLEWTPARLSGLAIAVTADNLTDSDYEQFPGTPAAGRQVSVSVRYDW